MSRRHARSANTIREDDGYNNSFCSYAHVFIARTAREDYYLQV